MKYLKAARLLLLIAAMLYPVKPASTAFYNGNELLDLCSSKRSEKQLLCLGLVSGYYDGMQYAFTCDRAGPKVIVQQLVDIVLKFLRDNPADRHIAAAALSFRAFRLAFDCKERNSAKS